MAFLKQIALLAAATCAGLFLAGCQPSDPNSPKVAELTAIAVEPGNVTLDVGGMQSLTVVGTFSDGSTRDVSFGSTFATSAGSIATVSPTGLVSAVAPGAATINVTHTSSGKTATAQVTVAPLRVISITLTPAASVLAPGATQQLLVTGRFNNATTGNVTAGSTFASSDATVATVDATGLITAVGPGNATITATHTASAATATATVDVTAAEFSSIDFDTAGVVYTLTGFGGAEDATLVPDPANATNTVARVVKSATAELWAGTTVSTGPNLTVGNIPFTATDTRITVRVYSPRVGVVVRLKVEDSADPARSVETEAVTTVANAWETLTFNFANPVSGTAPLNLAYAYNRMSIFFDFGTTGAAGGGGTFYFDDMRFALGGSSGNTGTCSGSCIDFSSPTVKYAPFEGLVLAAQADDPLDPSNNVAQFVKGPSGQPWAGATIYTIDATLSVPAFDLSTDKVVTLRVNAPAAGLTVRLKIEDATNPAVFLEQDALTTKANEWETLSFDFATPVGGSYDPANTYDRVSLFPVFSTTAPPATDLTFYFDELQYTAATGGGGGPLVFASGYASNNRTVEGGEWGFYSGNFTSYANTYAGGGFVDQGVAAADSFVYLVITTSAATTDGFMGIFTGAPGYTVAAPNAGVTLDGRATLKIEIGMAAEWFQQPSNKALTVRLIGAQVYDNGSGGKCQILLDTPLTPSTADLTTYTINLAGMTLAQGCNGGGFNSGVSTVAEALARPIGELHVQAVFPQVNTTVLAGTEYPTGFTRGAAWFE
jgi:hypothetical protein